MATPSEENQAGYLEWLGVLDMLDSETKYKSTRSTPSILLINLIGLITRSLVSFDTD